MQSARSARAMVLALAWVLLGAAGPSGGTTRAIVPVPFNDAATATVAVTMDQRDPRIGSVVGICFQASRAGFASLWNVSTRGEVARIFPNSFARGGAAEVEAEHRYCAGVAGDPFRFRVDGPPGTEDLYLLWTARPELQPRGGPYADAGALIADLHGLDGAANADWAAAKLTYDIVPAAGLPPVPPPPVTPPPVTPPPVQPLQDSAILPPADGSELKPKVLVLAMGANVGELRKANQDAAQFTAAVTGLFGVGPDNRRQLANATFADFKAGMDWLRDRARPQDFVFLYFSGHGGRFKNPNTDDGYDEFLVPYDFNPEANPVNAVISEQLANWIDALPTRHVIAVVDACHSAGVFRSLQAEVLGARKKFYALTPAAEAAMEAAAAAPTTRGIRRNATKANGVLLAASGRDQSALEGPQGSLFTLALVGQLTASKAGTLDDVFARSVADTQTLSDNRQTPEEVGDAAVARLVKFGP